jgi:hypothetical protein
VTNEAALGHRFNTALCFLLSSGSAQVASHTTLKTCMTYLWREYMYRVYILTCS